ncbi:MAG: M20/M25/M40 family metallo-hydrolase [Clostridiaceae bacterium]
MQMNGDRIKELTLLLTKIKSVVGTTEENHVTEAIYEILMALPYFKTNPEYLFYVENKNDKAGRKSLVAMMNGHKEDSKDTVILLGHIDTVGISDYGSLEHLATDPENLIAALKSENLPENVMRDLNSGDYLFGRGILDMKSGLSIIIHLLEILAENINELKGNLVVSFVSDEEGNSKGMLSVVPELVNLKKKYKLNYLTAIDTDYTSERALGDNSRYLYAGTVGKLMPSFYVVGKETHVGDPFGGLDSNELAASLVQNINLRVNLSDNYLGEVTVPPITLRLKDLKPEYSVQTNRATEVYFNFSTHSSTPDVVLAKLKDVARLSFMEVIEKLTSEYKIYTALMNLSYSPLPWKEKILTYEDLYTEVKKKISNLDTILADYTKELVSSEKHDEREISLLIVEKLHTLWGEKEPVIILYFSPPYYPHIAVNGETDIEKNLLNVLETHVDENLDHPIKLRKFYPYISDLSYFALPKESAVDSLKDNMPGFGISYSLPLEEIAELSLPVTNIGTYGFDAHKYTERIEVPYSFHTVPGIVLDTVLSLLDSTLKNN